jgi:hypothetical protein
MKQLHKVQEYLIEHKKKESFSSSQIYYTQIGKEGVGNWGGSRGGKRKKKREGRWKWERREGREGEGMRKEGMHPNEQTGKAGRQRTTINSREQQRRKLAAKGSVGGRKDKRSC